MLPASASHNLGLLELMSKVKLRVFPITKCSTLGRLHDSLWLSAFKSTQQSTALSMKFSALCALTLSSLLYTQTCIKPTHMPVVLVTNYTHSRSSCNWQAFLPWTPSSLAIPKPTLKRFKVGLQSATPQNFRSFPHEIIRGSHLGWDSQTSQSFSHLPQHPSTFKCWTSCLGVAKCKVQKILLYNKEITCCKHTTGYHMSMSRSTAKISHKQ